MKTRFALLLGLLAFARLSFSQSDSEKESVMKPVKQLFEAMQKGDSALLRKAFTKQMTMSTVASDKSGKLFFRNESSLDGFAKSIGTPHTESYNEVIWGEKIEVDGNLAQAWMNYAFYVGKTFIHCGVDAFHLVRGDDGNWRIFHLADTRQKTGCNVPQKISDQFK
ncbi:MAG TPA: nuclear transport factor 2 family protein [Cyclobacteriaceae bacterium]|jgi:hypothetical protein|nr:nuclear transport factor 2 family protein [Cyclobacteriaceae bacterium]